MTNAITPQFLIHLAERIAIAELIGDRSVAIRVEDAWLLLAAAKVQQSSGATGGGGAELMEAR